MKKDNRLVTLALAAVVTVFASFVHAEPTASRQRSVSAAALQELKTVPAAAAQAYLGTAVWAEIYRAPVKEQEAALSRLVRQGVTPPVIGLVLDGRLYAKHEGRDVAMAEQGARLHREGRDLVYDEACAEVPRKGDQLESSYRSADGRLEIRVDVRLLKHYAFAASPLEGLEAGEPVELAEVNPSNCARIVESRLMYEGTLTLQRKGKKARTEPIIVQSIIQ